MAEEQFVLFGIVKEEYAILITRVEEISHDKEVTKLW